MQFNEYSSMVKKLEDIGISVLRCSRSVTPSVRLSAFEEFTKFCSLYQAKCVLSYAKTSFPEKYLVKDYVLSYFALLDDEIEFIQNLVSQYNEGVIKTLGDLGEVTAVAFMEPTSKVGFDMAEWLQNDQTRNLLDGDAAAAALFKKNAGEIFEFACCALGIKVPEEDDPDLAGGEITSYDYARELERQLNLRLITDGCFTANGTQEARGEYARQFVQDSDNLKYLVLARYLHQCERVYTRVDAERDLGHMMEAIFQRYKVYCREHKIPVGTPLVTSPNI